MAQIVGIDAFSLAAETYSLSIPDVVLVPISENIKLFANGESCIEVLIEVKGKQMYEMNGFAHRESDKVVLRSANRATNSSAPSISSGANKDDINNLSDNLAKVVIASAESSGGVQKEPVQFGVGAPLKNGGKDISNYTHLTWHLNINKKIFLMVSK